MRLNIRSLKTVHKLITRRCYSNHSINDRIGILGVPFEKGQKKMGVSNGPDAIRTGGLIQYLQEISSNIDIRDYGNVEYKSHEKFVRQTENMKQLSDFSECTKVLSSQVHDIIANEKRMCITLGGDHSIAVGSVDGHLKAKQDIGLIWVDAHADINTNSTSTSGSIHGMPVGLLLKQLGYYWPYIPGMDWQKPEISADSIAYIGLRDVDKYEFLILEKFNIVAYGMREVEQFGIKEVVSQVLKKIDPDSKKSLHISFDIDSLDVLEAPSTGTPVRGGLSLREGIYIMEEIRNTGRLSAVDLVEVNPHIGSPEDVAKTVQAALLLIQAACGRNRKGNLPDHVDKPKII